MRTSSSLSFVGLCRALLMAMGRCGSFLSISTTTDYGHHFLLLFLLSLLLLHHLLIERHSSKQLQGMPRKPSLTRPLPQPCYPREPHSSLRLFRPCQQQQQHQEQWHQQQRRRRQQRQQSLEHRALAAQRNV
jgi:hypothetical protein